MIFAKKNETEEIRVVEHFLLRGCQMAAKSLRKDMSEGRLREEIIEMFIVRIFCPQFLCHELK